jgi:hypothetical protein
VKRAGWGKCGRGPAVTRRVQHRMAGDSRDTPSKAKPSQAKPSQAKPSQAGPGQAKPSQAQPRQASLRPFSPKVLLYRLARFPSPKQTRPPILYIYILVFPPRWQNSRLPPTCRREMGRVGGNASFRLIFRRFGCNPCDGDFGTLKAKIHTLNEEINLSA